MVIDKCVARLPPSRQPDACRQRVTLFTPNKQVRLTVHALPLPANLRTYLEQHEKALEELCSERAQQGERASNPETRAPPARGVNLPSWMCLVRSILKSVRYAFLCR